MQLSQPLSDTSEKHKLSYVWQRIKCLNKVSTKLTALHFTGNNKAQSQKWQEDECLNDQFAT